MTKRGRTRLAIGAVATAAAISGFTTNAKADLKLCNATTARVGVAIGYQRPSGWTTEGWWNISAKTCETLLKGRVPSRYIYVYAIDYERGGEWAGKTMMCTGPKSFSIKGADKCQERGYKRSGFYEVDTGDATDWTIRLSDPASEKPQG
ncbi:MAG: DUF1036 domain-containing protein [Pseudomonadota bacterium]